MTQLEKSITATDRSAEAPIVRPEVSIIVVSWHSAGLLGQSLAALRASAGAHSFEVIIHQNSSDESFQIARQVLGGDPLETTGTGRNLGFAGGVNSALERAHGELVMLLNPDCMLRPEALAILIDYLGANPGVAAVAPLLIGSDGLPQREFQLRRLPTLASLAADLLLVSRLFPSNRVTMHSGYRNLSLDQPIAVEQPAAAALLIRRSVIDRAGAMDERFAPAWFEDVDYCRRIAVQGGIIHLVPAAKADHRGGVALEHLPFEEFVSVYYRNLFQYAWKWLPKGEVDMLRWLGALGMILRAGAAVGGFSRARNRFTGARAYLRVAGRMLWQWTDPSRFS